MSDERGVMIFLEQLLLRNISPKSFNMNNPECVFKSEKLNSGFNKRVHP